MTNYLRLDYTNGHIIMDRTFAKNAQNTYSDEYAHLQEVRRDYPNFKVIARTIKKNDNKISYKGLTYDYMKNYILKNGSYEKRVECLAKFEALLEISKCHSNARRYPTIKKWFLETYPEIVKFGKILSEHNEYADTLETAEIIDSEAEDIEFIDEEIPA